jgi:RimJ/RimL family protein N-acetyltransferase
MVRPYRTEDLPTLIAIADAAFAPIWRMYRENLGAELADIEFPNCDTAIGRNVSNHAQHYPDWMLVYEFDGKPVGFVTFMLKPEKRLGILDDNGVHPDYQGRGFATELHRAALGYMKDHGMRYVRVLTGLDPAHAPARRAYEKAGFDLQKPDVTYYADLTTWKPGPKGQA